MMDWTDRHCRVFHRTLSRRALLYTEMVTANAVIHGDRDRLLGFDPVEHPVALQLGGSDPALLARAARIGADWGYDEVNLNVGCPSDRVQSGCFGAALMLQPALVADCVAAMIDAAGPVEVTVKCRIGVDDQEPEESSAQVSGIHAESGRAPGGDPRPQGLASGPQPEGEPRDPAARPRPCRGDEAGLSGPADPDQRRDQQPRSGGGHFLAQGLDGVMVGRAAYHDPAAILLNADQRIWGDPPGGDAFDAVEAMRPYIEGHLARGGKLSAVTRHMLGLFNGRPGARGWRRVLSERANRPGAGLEVLDAALDPLHAGAQAA
jgi:tRNA-dihydrouridine synthase A